MDAGNASSATRPMGALPCRLGAFMTQAVLPKQADPLSFQAHCYAADLGWGPALRPEWRRTVTGAPYFQVPAAFGFLDGSQQVIPGTLQTKSSAPALLCAAAARPPLPGCSPPCAGQTPSWCNSEEPLLSADHGSGGSEQQEAEEQAAAAPSSEGGEEATLAGSPHPQSVPGSSPCPPPERSALSRQVS